MNGLNAYEEKKIRTLRNIVRLGQLTEAKRLASLWVKANKRRRVIREAALRTIKGMHS